MAPVDIETDPLEPTDEAPDDKLTPPLPVPDEIEEIETEPLDPLALSPLMSDKEPPVPDAV